MTSLFFRRIQSQIEYYRIFFLGLFAPRKLADILYVKNMGGERINWENPTDLNEKINWLKFYSDTSEWTRCADKFLVREFVESRGCKDLLVPLLGVWEKVNEINWLSLPNQFVLKTNNGAGTVLIVKDKSSLNIDDVKGKLNNWMHKKFGIMTAEPHYLKINPKIIAEELLHNDSSFSSSLIDYKIWCFNGKPFATWCCYNRQGFMADTEWHDLDWNFRPEWSVFTDHYRDGKGRVPKPFCYKEMLEAASSLSKGFPEVRVDFYIVNHRVFLGELTFFPTSGFAKFIPESFDRQLGDWINLDLVRST